MPVHPPEHGAAGGDQHREHRAAVRPARARPGAGLAGRAHRRHRPGPGSVGGLRRRPGRLPAAGRRGRPGARRARARAGGLAPGPQLQRLAPPAGDLRPDRHPHPGRGWTLRPGHLQRPPPPRAEGHDVGGRALRHPRPSAGRHPQQGPPGRAQAAPADRLLLHRARRGRPRPRPAGAGHHPLRLPHLPADRLCQRHRPGRPPRGRCVPPAAAQRPAPGRAGLGPTLPRRRAAPAAPPRLRGGLRLRADAHLEPGRRPTGRPTSPPCRARSGR